MNTRRSFLAISLTLLVSGCGGGGDSEEHSSAHGVAYNGTTLTVNGRDYLRGAQASTAYVPGQVIAFPRSTQLEAARATLKQFDLTFTEQGTEIIVFIVYVPVNFERQWATALRDIAYFENATLNELNTPQ